MFVSGELERMRAEAGLKSERRRNKPRDFPGEAPQKTHILMGLWPLVTDLGSMELGLSFERGCGVWFSGVSLCAPNAGEAPPDAMLGIYLFQRSLWIQAYDERILKKKKDEGRK
jgi:hypothetical protein